MASSQFLVLIFLIAMISMVLAAPVPEKHHRHRHGHGHRRRRPTSTTTAATSTTTTTTEEPTATTITTSKAEPTAAPPSSVGSAKGTYSGDGTWYDVGLGSCGWDNSNDELVAAVNHIQMANGANPNNNPNCGKMLRINGPNGSVNVKVVDTCPGCSFGDIDLSPAAFEKISELGVGRIHINWSWA